MKGFSTITINTWIPPVSSLIHRLKKEGFVIKSVYDGEELIKCNNNKKVAVETIVSVDEARLYVEYKGKKLRLYILPGNDPGEIVCDYTDHPELERVVNKFSDYWEGKTWPIDRYSI